MIGFLSGLVKSVRASQAIILAGGVGYLVSIPLSQSPRVGESIDLYVHTHVREDTFALYGFRDEAGLDLFEKLISVSGVGPKSALAIVSVGTAQTIRQAIENTNLNFFTAVPGIGKKSAQKIIIELKPKFSRSETDLNSLDGNPELTTALAQLGFTRAEIIGVVSQVDSLDSLQNQIKQALKLLR